MAVLWSMPDGRGSFTASVCSHFRHGSGNCHSAARIISNNIIYKDITFISYSKTK